MSSPFATLRRWLRIDKRDIGSISNKCRRGFPSIHPFRPAGLSLEDRNAPGSLLGELMAVALGQRVPLPLDQLDWLVGLNATVTGLGSQSANQAGFAINSSGLPSVSLSAPERALLPVSDTDQSYGSSALAESESFPSQNLRLTLDDELLFLPVQPESDLFGTSATGDSRMSQPAAGANPSSRSTRSDGHASHGSSPIPSDQNAEFLATGKHAGTEHVVAALEPPEESFENSGPVAQDDSLAANEDTPLTISITDLLVNDTDADGDALYLVDWSVETPHGTLERTSETELRYTPFVDFYWLDTFTYTISDGTDRATATVTVNVNSVNDAPRAFNDAFRFVHGPPMYPNFPSTIPYSAVDSGSVFDNDSDVDLNDLGGTVAQLDTAGVVGTIIMNSNGTFDWIGPDNFYGESSFRYKIGDWHGGVSDWATVKLWAHPTPFTDSPTFPNADTFAIGEEARTFNVLDNDSGGTLAVLVSRPPAKMVTGFGFDGVLTYAPPAVGDATLTYRLFTANGTAMTAAQVQLVKPELTIYHGQSGAAVREEDETTIGAFTVVNKNDTDGDGITDATDYCVSPQEPNSNAKGFAEVDLMKLIVMRPNVQVLQGPVTITLNNAKGKIYQHATKAYLNGTDGGVRAAPGESITLQPGHFATVGGTLDSLSFWVEIFDKADSLRSVSVTMSYDGATDEIKATGVWAEMTNNRTEGTSLSAGADRKELYQSFVASGAQLGKQTMSRASNELIDSLQGLTPGQKANLKQLYHSNNMIEIEFTVSPPTIFLHPIVNFDLTRTADMKYKLGNNQPADFKARPEFLDFANDESNSARNHDNDADMIYTITIGSVSGFVFINKLYSLDGPGQFNERWVWLKQDGTAKRDVRLQSRGNFYEFARVQIGSAFTYPAPGHRGSRSSDFFNWHSLLDLNPVADPQNPGNNIWTRGDADRNSVGPDHKNIDDFA